MRKEHTDLHADVSIRMTETLFFFTCGPLLFAQFALSLPVACGISGQKEDRKWRKCWRMRSRWKTEIDDLVPVLGFTNDPRFHFTEEHIMLTAGLAALSDRKMINVHGKPPLVFLPTLGYSVTPHELEGARGETLMVSRQDSWHIAPKSSRGRKTLPTRDRDARAPQRASPSQTSQQVITERLDGAVSQTGQP
jgi:hypothetical protein